MPDRSAHRPSPSFTFERYEDGCDSVLEVLREGRKRPLARICFWTATGITETLTEVLVRTPGLLDAAKQARVQMQHDLGSPDPKVRYGVEQDAHLFVGLWAAIAQAERSVG